MHASALYVYVDMYNVLLVGIITHCCLLVKLPKQFIEYLDQVLGGTTGR